MNKQELLARLRAGLTGLPPEDVAERLTFYSEMIDDRIEEGLSEENAVAAVGFVDEIVAQIIADTPLTRIARERMRPKGRRGLGTVLLILGSPVWLSLGIAVAAVAFSLYASLWAVLVSLWAVFVSLAAGFVGGVSAAVVFSVGGHVASGVALLAAGLVCAGLSIFAFFGCRAATAGLLWLTKKAGLWLKCCFVRKGDFE